MDRESEINNPTFSRPVQTVQDWKEIKDKLSVVNPIRFIIDDYKVSMHMVNWKMKLVIVLFIDGKYDVETWNREAPEILKKFYQKKEIYIHGKKFRDAIVKQVGKRKAKAMGAFDKGFYIQHWWTSFRSLRVHLEKTCKKISVCKADLHLTSLLDVYSELKDV